MQLVSGGCGLIGGHLARHLARSGESVRVLDLISPAETVDLMIEFRRGDVRDPSAVADAITGCSVVYHQAAFVSVPASVSDPWTCYDINANGTLRLILAARATGVYRLVAASSSAVYGNDPSSPKQETMLRDLCSPYAGSKAATEDLCLVAHRAGWLETVALRYFNVYGPGQFASSPYAAVIPRFIDELVAGRTPEIYGDGRQTRDFVYVEDVVDANLLAAGAPGVSGRVFNIGSGVQTSLNDLLEIIAGILGVPVRAEYREERPGDVRHSVADISNAHQHLGFTPRTSLEDGLRRTVEAHLERHGAPSAPPGDA